MTTEFKAIFFDRDETLARRSPKVQAKRDAVMAEILGKPDFELVDDEASDIFWKVLYASDLPIGTPEKEKEFWEKYLGTVLQENGFEGDLVPHVKRLMDEFTYSSSLEPYDEVAEVMAKLKSAGYLIGIISDTFPSLEESFIKMGLSEFVDCYTASMVVGASKPDTKIYYEALKSLGTSPKESLFVDDRVDNVDAAINLGMTAFRLDREATTSDLETRVICDTRPILDFLGIDTDSASEPKETGPEDDTKEPVKEGE